MNEARQNFNHTAQGSWLAAALLAIPLLGMGANPAAAQSDGFLPPIAGAAGASTPSVVTGKPYEAERIVRTRRSLADGTISTQNLSLREARDSSGRTLEEVDTDLPATASRPSQHLVVEDLFDPTARTVLIWTSLSRTATLTHLPAKPIFETHPKPSPDEDALPLGHRMIHGLLCTGYSVQKTIPAGTMGNEAPITTRHEWWIDEDLQVRALDISDDPRRGLRTNELVSIKLGEPDDARFHLPSGYTVKEANPPTAATSDAPTDETLDLQHAPAISHSDAIALLASQDRKMQMQGAAVLVKEAQTTNDATVKGDVAYRLARADVGLNEALSLAHSAMENAEQDCAAPTAASPAQRSQFTAEIALARDWDTLGYIYNRKGDSETAKKYIESAWELDPVAYYGSHLARILEQSGDTDDAIAVYRAALQARGSDALKATMRERLAALAGTSADSSAAQEEEIPDTGKLAGSGFFDIIYFSSAKSPTVEFAGGDEPLRALAAAIAQQEKTSFALPDTGPERVVLRVKVTCGAPAGTSSGCRLLRLGAHEARELLSGN